ncbi:CocE/NonD family hydrolase [Verrucomicrobiota bacterium]
MSDGVRLGAQLILPGGPGPFPAVLQITPYREAAWPDVFVKSGYARIVCHVRGTGNSEGYSTEAFSPRENRDGYEVVEWIAAQPWCSGAVGMMGISYCGIACIETAMLQPPHLKAIVPVQACDDLFTGWACPGGSPRPFIYEQTCPLMLAYNSAPPSPEACGAGWQRVWRERLENNRPWGEAFLDNLLDGPFWRERSLPPDYVRIKCPAFFIAGWADWYPGCLLNAFENLEGPKRILIGPWAHSFPKDAWPAPRVDSDREMLRWFDQWLKGIETGIREEPPVVLFVRDCTPSESLRARDNGVFRSETEWPPRRACPMELFLSAGGQLRHDCGTEHQRDTMAYDPTVGAAAGRYVIGQIPPGWGMPLDQREDEARSLVYTGEVLEEDLEVTGTVRAILSVSSSAEIAYLAIKLCDATPTGESVLVTKGGLNAVDRHSHGNPSPLVPGKTYELEIPLLACAYRFKAGHRIRVAIAWADFQNAWPTPEPGVNTVHRGPAHPSRVILPVVSARVPTLPLPDLNPSPVAMSEKADLPRPRHEVTRDRIRNTVAVDCETRCGSGINASHTLVSADDPGRTLVESSCDLSPVATPLGEATIRAECTTRSDADTFRHHARVQVRIDGREYFKRRWDHTVPRRSR